MQEQVNGHALDFSAFDTAPISMRGFDVNILSPGRDRRPTGLVITVLGADSDAYRERDFEIRKRWRDSMIGTARRERTEKDARAESIERMVAATLGWKPGKIMIREDDAEIEFAFPADAARFYERCPDVVDQLMNAVHERANFLRGSGTPS